MQTYSESTDSFIMISLSFPSWKVFIEFLQAVDEPLLEARLELLAQLLDFGGVVPFSRVDVPYPREVVHSVEEPAGKAVDVVDPAAGVPAAPLVDVRCPTAEVLRVLRHLVGYLGIEVRHLLLFFAS